MFFEFFALAISLAVLAKSSELTVKLAERFSMLTGVGKIAVGFIFIGLATSLPELSIALLSSMRGEALLSIGNIIGSNVMNLTLIFGIISLMAAIRISKPDYREIRKTVGLMALLALPLIFMDSVWWIFGLVCLSAFALYVKSIMKKEFRRNKRFKPGGLASVETIKTLLFLLASVAAVVISSDFVTNSSITISNFLGVAESLIGASILALGTTLPDLSVTIAAVKRKDIDIAIGDNIGAIAIKMTLVLGLASLAAPVYFGDIIRYSAAMMVAIGMVFLGMSSFGRLKKADGIILLALLSAFMGLLFFLARIE